MTEMLIIYGAGGHAKVAIDAARLGGLKIALILDDHFPQPEFFQIPVRPTSHAKTISRPYRFFVAIGNNSVRAAIFERLLSLGGHPFSIIHPSAIVSPLAEIGDGTILTAGCIINPGARIGRNCVVNTAASVDHDCTLGQHVFIGPGVRLAGSVEIGDSASIFTGAILIPGLRIGRKAVIGAGAVVLKDVPEEITVVGNPARPIPFRP